ncbi:hypothetical protein BGW36DRAFT_65008 [Talaromyces proteolyticus]|uniref:Putative transcription factor kapC n=1 Tax=Talaromyces proteolyticus TaxID=1131652 RepID=A0AAD4PRW3_9EURO|nr:uncharacterized protein BGW36DRAFT_65008 [Talaromyces proteolyticus]KAH8689935.1 hypothetical protein BGW36DRAFT_65008 [Talaromyces proteolyticus]
MQPALAPHPSMQNTAQLLAAQQHLSSQGPEGRSQPSGPNQNIDPAIAGSAMLAAANSQGPSLAQVMPQVMAGVHEAAGSDAARKTYGKRELSTSKRAAQNRAAQRAFRQRKEGYIRKLEEQVREYEVLSESYKALQAENYQLREYIIGLQSRLIDSQNEVPALPENIDLNQPRPEPPTLSGSNNHRGVAAPGGASSSPGAPVPPGQQGQPSAPPPSGATSEDIHQLNRIAVAGLGMPKHQHDDDGYPGVNRGIITKVEPPHGLPMLS